MLTLERGDPMLKSISTTSVHIGLPRRVENQWPERQPVRTEIRLQAIVALHARVVFLVAL